MGQLWDGGCITFLTKKELIVTNNGTGLFKGIQNVSDGLWDLNIHITLVASKLNRINHIISNNKTQ